MTSTPGPVAASTAEASSPVAATWARLGSGARCRSAITTTRPPTGTSTAEQVRDVARGSQRGPPTLLRCASMEPASRAGRSLTALLETARRLGPLPYSDDRPEPGAGTAATPLAGWMVDADRRLVGRARAPRPVHAGRDRRRRRHPGGGRSWPAGPACLTALRYVLVEDDPAQREHQRAHLPIESPILVLGPVGPADQEEDPTTATGSAHPGRRRIGPLITSLAEPPVVDGRPLVVAVGWVGRLPSDRLEWRDGRWWEIRLAADRTAAVCRSCRCRSTGARRRRRAVGRRRRSARPSPRAAPATPCSRRRWTGWPARCACAGSGGS